MGFLSQDWPAGLISRDVIGGGDGFVQVLEVWDLSVAGCPMVVGWVSGDRVTRVVEVPKRLEVVKG